MRYNEVKVTKGVRLSVAKSLRKTRKRSVEDAVEEALQRVGFNDGRYNVDFLSDLIEPEPERTCKPVVVEIEEASYGYIVECSECRHTFGEMFTSKEAADRFASALPVYHMQYCAKCGAKVVNE